MDPDIYDLDTASVPRGDGVRDLTLTDRWNTPLGTPNGGYILAAMLRGLGEEEVRAAAEPTGAVEVRCEFCGREYRFPLPAIGVLFGLPEANSHAPDRVQ